nr:uracil-DNA glycosylase [Raoultella sp. NCTC 9187]
MTTPLTWHDVLAEEKQQPYFVNTLKTVAEERQSGMTIYPPQKDIFNAFRYTEIGDVKVIISGRIPITGRDRRTAWPFPYSRGSKLRRRC